MRVKERKSNTGPSPGAWAFEVDISRESESLVRWSERSRHGSLHRCDEERGVRDSPSCLSLLFREMRLSSSKCRFHPCRAGTVWVNSQVSWRSRSSNSFASRRIRYVNPPSSLAGLINTMLKHLTITRTYFRTWSNLFPQYFRCPCTSEIFS